MRVVGNSGFKLEGFGVRDPGLRLGLGFRIQGFREACRVLGLRVSAGFGLGSAEFPDLPKTLKGLGFRGLGFRV